MRKENLVGRPQYIDFWRTLASVSKHVCSVCSVCSLSHAHVITASVGFSGRKPSGGGLFGFAKKNFKSKINISSMMK